MSLLNGTQRIVVSSGLIKIIGDDDFVICEGKTMDECLNKYFKKLKQEARSI